MKIWTESTDKQVITRAANTIDAPLRTDPLTVGESPDDDVRLLYSVDDFRL